MTTLLIHYSITNPTEASGPSPLMVELTALRQRMVRDLEQFLSFELNHPRPIWPRRGNKSQETGGADASRGPNPCAKS